MAARRITLKLAAFLAAFAVALSLVALFAPAPPPELPGTPVATVESCPPATEFALAENLRSEVELISLDRESRRSYTRLKLRLIGGSLPPEKLWVRTHFFNPSAPSLRIPAGDPVAVVRPFDRGGTVIVASPCSWCYDPDAPLSGYFANVEIYEHNYDEKPYTLGSQFVDLTTAVPVVVHADRASSRRR